MLKHFVMACVLLGGVTSASTVCGDLSPQTIAAIDSAAQGEMTRQELVGLAVGIVDANEVAWTKGYGFADRASRAPVSNKTLFRWASISKPLTAVAAMQLVQQGKLDLDADVRVLVPEFPDKGVSISMRQALGHLGGIVHYRNGPVVQVQQSYESDHPFDDVIVALDRFKDSPLVAEPCTMFAYSTHGYILASAVVQRAGGAPFQNQVRSRIAAPLGMTTLRPDYQWQQIPGRAKGYRRPLGVVVESTDTDVSWKLGGGGWVSNVDDLARFAAGLLSGEVLDKAATKQMWTSQKTSDGASTGYGLGFGVSGKGASRVISHSGAQEKTRTLMLLFPERDAAIVVMTNCEYADVRAVAKAIRGAMEAGSGQAERAQDGSRATDQDPRP